MIVTNIRKRHSWVWILEREGFINGRIVDLIVKYTEDDDVLDVVYFIKQYGDQSIFHGHQKPADLVFETLDEAVDYYRKNYKQ